MENPGVAPAHLDWEPPAVDAVLRSRGTVLTPVELHLLGFEAPGESGPHDEVVVLQEDGNWESGREVVGHAQKLTPISALDNSVGTWAPQGRLHTCLLPNSHTHTQSRQREIKAFHQDTLNADGEHFHFASSEPGPRLLTFFWEVSGILHVPPASVSQCPRRLALK